MSATATNGVELRDLVRDLRHQAARAASDLADWLEYLTVAGKRGQTLYTYTRQIAPLLRAHPDLDVSEFTAAHINTLLTDKPVQSRHYTRGIYARWFNWLVDEERIEKNPMRRVPQMRKPPRRPRDIFTDAEVALLEALPVPDGPLLTLMFTTGMRKAECRYLRLEHIHLERARLIVVGGKGGKDRIIPLPDTALRAVVDLETLEGIKPTDHLWYSTYGGGRYRRRRDPIASSTFDRWWGYPEVGVLARANVRYLNVHQSRHTYGHRLRELGYDLEERKVLMGHESIATTEAYYGRVTIEDVAAKVTEVGV